MKKLRAILSLVFLISLASSLLLAQSACDMSNVCVAAALLVSDNFTRANSGTLGANWTNSLGLGDPIQILSNKAANVSSAYGMETWTANAFTNNQFSKATISGVGDVQNYVAVRASATVVTEYACGLRESLDASHYLMFKLVSGVSTQLGATSGTTVNAADIVELDAVGTTLTCKVNGSTIITQTDASIASGNPGIALQSSSTAAQLSAWSGGNL